MRADFFSGEYGRAVALGLAGLGLLLVVQLVVLPLGRGISDSERNLQRAQKALARAERLAREYTRLRNAVSSTAEVSGDGGGGTLFARMEAVGRGLALGPMVESMRPENRTLPDGSLLRRVRVRLGGLGMSELLEYLHRCEAGTGDRVESLGLRRNRERLLDVDMVIVRPEGS